MSKRPEQPHSYWQAHITRFQSSGLSGKQYCAREALIYHRFVYWRRKLMPNPSTVEKKTVAPSAFIAVKPESPIAETAGLQLSLPNGLVIGNIQSDNLALVPELLGQL